MAHYRVNWIGDPGNYGFASRCQKIGFGAACGEPAFAHIAGGRAGASGYAGVLPAVQIGRVIDQHNHRIAQAKSAFSPDVDLASTL